MRRRSVRTIPKRIAVAAVAAAAALGALMTSGAAAGAAESVAAAGSLPANATLYKDPDSQVARWVAANQSDSRWSVINSRIASQPQGIWFSNYRPTTVTADVRRVTSAAEAAGQIPTLVAYMIPNRDCGGASAGGAPDLASYDAWARNFAAGLGTGTVLVILEPDSLALQTCMSASEIAARNASLSRAAAAIHAANPNAKVYFDGGHSAWNGAAEQARRLRDAGILTNGDGVYTNVSNFQHTASEVSYGKQVLAALGNPADLHLVVDTSRNGAGPAPGGAWCDPAGRRIGTNPTTNTGDAAVDAYLWVKPPGEVDGCAGPAGTFSPAYAYELAGSGSGSPTPTPTPTDPPANGACAVDYRITNSWSGGFTAEVVLRNNGAALNGWTLGWTFPGDQRITSAWNSRASQSGNAVTVTDAGYNGSLATGASTSFGFQATVGSSNAEPTAFTLGGVSCTVS
ncbi:glycoside hydrolase family 6 protein [Allostreptomyces psammosilenae]|uniref:Glucanase n=1 Tax=Allostreptomyces psammosilenae TaxID=1892865 RepID=A0A853A0B9_9ACTN|nr:glycoside hydrolase family 6 protein [Allostreptomyces psammosilenae]NYI04261.1 endoglucanase [Allostreptomyces psammosilenae]